MTPLDITCPDDLSRNPHLSEAYWRGVGDLILALNQHLHDPRYARVSADQVTYEVLSRLYELEMDVDTRRTRLAYVCRAWDTGPPTPIHADVWSQFKRWFQ